MRRLSPAAALVAALATNALAGVPDWMKEVARAPVPAYSSETRGVVLLDDTTTNVTARGDIRTTRRLVYKILGTAGADLAVESVHSDKETRLTSFRAWALTASGQEYQVKGRDAIETAAFTSDLYSDQKLTVLRAPASDPGTVVGFEIEQRDRPYSLQDVWQLHRDIPVVRARYTLTMPNGWTHEAKWFNSEAIAPRVAGQTTVWEVANLGEIKDEPRMPSPRAIGGRMAINFIPDDARHDGKVHLSWDDVARAYSELTVSRTGSTPALQMKTKELIAGKEAALDKIRALATFAQRDVRYVAIEIGIGGLQPHLAGDVFTNRYGDCKDKVTVLQAMLREAGFDSRYVLANVYRGWVDPSFASIGSFNHAIIAIKLPAGMPVKELAAVVDDPAGGKMLLFDPTAESIPFGTLPPYLQENHVLVVHGDRGQLVEVLPHAAEASRLAVSAKLKIDPAGALSGEISEVRTGALASYLRNAIASLDEAGRQKFYDARVARYLAGSTKVTDLKIENVDDPSKDLVVKYSIISVGYAKRTGGMLFVRPRVIGTKVESVLDLKERRYGYETDGPSLEHDDIEITLPLGVTVSELPPAAKVETPVLRYTSESKADGNKLSYRREYRIERVSVSRDALAELNKAFTAIQRDERNSAILKGGH
jgi:hypothetical protein